MPSIDLNVGTLPFWDMVSRLAVATLLGGLVGLERERRERAAGLRTHALVSLATGFMLLVQAGLKPLERRLFARPTGQHRVVLDVVHGIDQLDDIMRALANSAVRLRSLRFDQSSGSGSDVVKLTLMAEDQGDILEFITRLRASETIRRITYQRSASPAQDREHRGDQQDDDDDEAES